MACKHSHQIGGGKEALTHFEVGQAGSFRVEGMIFTLTFSVMCPAVHAARVAATFVGNLRLAQCALESTPYVESSQFRTRYQFVDVVYNSQWILSSVE